MSRLLEYQLSVSYRESRISLLSKMKTVLGKKEIKKVR